MARVTPPWPPEFRMEPTLCNLPLGRLTEDKTKKINKLILDFRRKCALDEAKLYADILKLL